MNLITLIQQSSKAIVVFILLFFSSILLFPPRGTFGANFGLTLFLWLTKAKLVTWRAWGKSQWIQANQKNNNPLRKKKGGKLKGDGGVAIEWCRAGSHSLRWNVPRSVLTKESNSAIARSFLCVRDVIQCDAESRESHTLMLSFMRLPGRVLYPFKNLPPSTLLLLRLLLSHSFFPPLSCVILPDYYSRGQSGIRTDPWHWSWIVGFLRCLLVCVCVRQI